MYTYIFPIYKQQDVVVKKKIKFKNNSNILTQRQFEQLFIFFEN